MTLKGSVTPTQQRSIVFVLGGPGSGKGTQVQSQTPPRIHRAVLTCCTALLSPGVLPQSQLNGAVLAQLQLVWTLTRLHVDLSGKVV